LISTESSTSPTAGSPAAGAGEEATTVPAGTGGGTGEPPIASTSDEIASVSSTSPASGAGEADETRAPEAGEETAPEPSQGDATPTTDVGGRGMPLMFGVGIGCVVIGLVLLGIWRWRG
jgi:hypothetical protein